MLFVKKMAFQARHNNQKAQETIHGKVTKEKHESAMCLDLKDVMTQPFPSRQCAQARFIRKVMELIPYYERCLQLIGGVTLCGDKSHKVVKFIFVGGSRGCAVRAFDSVHTVMNEFNQIVTIHFVLAGDCEEVESIL